LAKEQERQGNENPRVGKVVQSGVRGWLRKKKRLFQGQEESKGRTTKGSGGKKKKNKVETRKEGILVEEAPTKRLGHTPIMEGATTKKKKRPGRGEKKKGLGERQQETKQSWSRGRRGHPRAGAGKNQRRVVGPDKKDYVNPSTCVAKKGKANSFKKGLKRRK